MNGRIIGVKLDGEFVPCETGCDVSFNGERINISSSENGNWRKSIAGYRSWNVGVNGDFVINESPASFLELVKAIDEGRDIDLIITMRVSNAQVFTIMGTVGTTNVTLNAPSTGKATWTGSFDGVGRPNIDYDIYNTIINGLPIDEEKPFIVDTGGV